MYSLLALLYGLFVKGKCQQWNFFASSVNLVCFIMKYALNDGKKNCLLLMISQVDMNEDALLVKEFQCCSLLNFLISFVYILLFFFLNASPQETNFHFVEILA